MRKAIVRAFNDHSGFLLTRKLSPAEAAESQIQFDSQVSFLLSNALQSATETELADTARFLTSVVGMAQRGVRPKSQLLQECFALAWNGPSPETFVEVGAAGPEFLSNTFVLQSEYGWGGLLVEPNPEFARGLLSRVSESVRIAEVAAGSRGDIEFVVAGELSSSVDMLPADASQQIRAKMIRDSGVIRVSRIPLDDLLLEHFQGISNIGFLSIDVEGAEQDVLDSIDWERWSFNAISVENNFRRTFEKHCDEALLKRGYRRVLSRISGWDSWYVPIKS